MATSATISVPGTTATAPATAVLVSVPSLPEDALNTLLENVSAAFPGDEVLVASPDGPEGQPQTVHGSLRIAGYAPTMRSHLEWTEAAADFFNTYDLARTYPARAILALGAQSETLAPAALHALATAVLDGAGDLVVPRYTQSPRSGLVNSAVLYPVSRALFGARPRFPLAPDFCMSIRMAERLATAAQRFTSINQPDALLWPVAEAAVAGFSIIEVEAGERMLPLPAATDLNSLLAQVTGSLFADLDQKAAYWQRARPAAGPRPSTSIAAATPPEAAPAGDEIQPMLDSFRLDYGNLREIWSLVLPPQSLFSLKRLAEMPSTSFRMPDSLWARILYDFLLAFRLRTINRGHLLGALTPLYLAWVASHILLTRNGTDAERHVEAQAAAFEADKAYLVSRWRWPDRFNP